MLLHQIKKFAICLCFVSTTILATPQFEKKFEKLIQTHKLPGAVLLIRKGNKTIHYKAYGKVNVEKDEAMRKNAIFRIFSMSKPITAVALLQLVDSNKISLEDDIRKYLPMFDPFEIDGEETIVTVHQLLSHTAGFGYGGGLKSWVDIRYLLANPLNRDDPLSDLVDDLSGIDLKYLPGSKFEYSIASDIQGALIESVTKQNLDEYIKENILNPLNMIDTDFFVPNHKQKRLVDMYEYDATTFEEAYVFNSENILFSETGEESEYLEKPELYSGGGGLVSTAADYSNFVTMLLNHGKFNGKRILSASLVKRMLSSHIKGLDPHFLPRVYKGVGFGYGIGIKETDGDIRNQGSYFWGGMGGTIFWADPIADIQVVAMMQVEDGWIALEKWLIPEVYQLIKDLEEN